MHATADAPTCPGDIFEQEAIPHAPQLYRAALRLTQDRGHAEDLVQDTFTRAYVKFDQFKPGTNLGGWLHRIMISIFYTGCRKRNRRPAEVLAPEQSHGGQTLVQTSRSAEAEALGGMGDSAVVQALTELPTGYKTVIYLADIEGYRYTEIAELLGIPLGTVMSRVHRGRSMLRAKVSRNAGTSRPSKKREVPASDGREVTELAA
ncbi:MAG: sigma-70 family RNA polymerase sigma factor [Actinobacteria bacterium]|nr:sigma-70 family RNA polymerase sigma factor [Actinomycetota bacterium]MBO0834739.1 sigma-70 family RNA polymerase sigma factor [Actinomycetota bacterium]